MGLASLPTPSEGVLTLLVVNTALTVSILKEILRSALAFIGLRPFDPPPLPGDADGSCFTEPTLADRFRTRFKPSKFGRRRAPAERCADCRVCLARFEPEAVVNRLPCGHLFHRACLETWLDYHHATCPLCRSRVLPADEPSASSSAWF